jgi:hypothetical protein
MPPLGWLLLAVIAAIAAYVVGWPAWRGSRARGARDTNTERYLAWRGRASEAPRGGLGPSPEERRRLYAGAALGAVAVLALVAFFVTS